MTYEFKRQVNENEYKKVIFNSTIEALYILLGIHSDLEFFVRLDQYNLMSYVLGWIAFCFIKLITKFYMKK